MSAVDKLRERFGSNLAESMGANRSPRAGAGGIAPQASARPTDPLEGTSRFGAARMIPVAQIEADPGQPRSEFDPAEIDQLAASLNDHGQIQPIMVRPSGVAGQFIIVAGERRHRASVAANRPEIIAVVIEETDPARIFEMQMVENCLRSDLKPVEQARGFRRLMDQTKWSAARMGKSVGMSESAIVRALALLSLPAPVQEMVNTGRITPSVAYEISKADPATHQAVADRVVVESLNRAATIEAVRQAPQPEEKMSSGKAKPKAKVHTSRTFKGQGGLRGLVITATRAKGVDAGLMLEALAQWADAIRAEMMPEG